MMNYPARTDALLMLVAVVAITAMLILLPRTEVTLQADSLLIPKRATIVVAASNSSTASKSQADYICDGVADENEINSAITALGPTGGEVILEGTYNITTTSVYVNQSNITIRGRGEGAVLEAGTNLNQVVVSVGAAASSITLRNLTIDGNKLNNIGGKPNIMLAGGTSDVRIMGVESVDSDGIGILVEDSIGFLIEGCRVITPATKGINATSPDASRGRIAQNYIYNSGDTAIEVDDGATEVWVIGNTIDGSNQSIKGAGISVHNHEGTVAPTQVAIINNIIRNSNDDGIRVIDNNGVTIPADIIISGNWISLDRNDEQGIIVRGGRNVMVSSNITIRGDSSPQEDFVVVALPDSQFYSQSYPQIFASQTQWIVDNRDTENVVFVTHEGDIVQTASADSEWQNADAAMSILDGVVPYAFSVGNHDMDPNSYPDETATYNTYFPYTRYEGEAWYGGHYGTNNDNNYELFSAGGMDFIILHLEYDVDDTALTWADNVLRTYNDRRAIVTSHSMLYSDGSRTAIGNRIYDALKDNPNLFLILSGHEWDLTGEARRTDTYEGNVIYTLLADYQGRSNGGNGWLRIMEFSPENNEINVRTYSPYLDQYETDDDSQFTLGYDMTTSTSFVDIGIIGNVTSGG